MPLIPEEVIKHLFMVSKQISGALLRALQVQGTNIFVANGAVAGQKAQHFMIHIIPRTGDDGVGLTIKGHKADENILDDLRKRLVSKINKDFGIKTIEPEEKKPKEKIVGQETEEHDKEQKIEEKPKKDKKSAKKEKNKESEEEQEPPEEEPQEEIPEEKEQEISLDDIAKLITGGK